MRLAPFILTTAALLATSAVPGMQTSAFAQDATSIESGTDAVTGTLTGTLAIDFTDLASEEGQILYAVYDEAGWNGGKPVRGGAADAEGGQASILVQDLPSGRYGIKAYHDLNGNGQMDANPFGIPIEPFAFSNNAPASMGPPAWADAAFEVTAGTTTQTIAID